jgi:hypothetical protein
MAATLWGYRQDVGTDQDLVGYDVEATDGHIGKIDEASNDADRSHVVVDTGFWIFGKKRLIPAGVITRVDPTNTTVYLSMTKDQVKDAPDWHQDWNTDDTTRDTYSSYYNPFSF